MDSYKVIQVKESIFKNNNQQADHLRLYLKNKKVFLLNLMSSPGSGKTSTIVKTITSLQNTFSIGVMEADLDSEVDAITIAKTKTKVIQLHTGGMCHLDADMTKQGILQLGIEGLDLIILENVGNLVCPAEFDTGASKNVMILSVPEGDDKPLKYPLMFSIVDVLLVNKIDTLDYFDFNLDNLSKYAKNINPNIKIIPISSKTGEGIEIWCNWLIEQIIIWNK